jgi:plastocyanin
MIRNKNTAKPTTVAMFCLLVLGILALLAACGSNSSTPASPSSPAATTNPAPTATSSGYSYGKYGNGGSNTTPTATTAPTGATQTVTITTDSNGFTFSPKTLAISVGATVIWKNTTQTPHTVTSNDGTSFNTGDTTPVAPGTTFSFKFTKAGTFAYHCDFHPSMMATIIVK